MGLLDRAAERLLEGLRLRVRPSVTSSDQGGQRSETLASGLEFADHRDYVPGDDVRQIDWKAFARHKHLTVRTFEEERDVRIYVLLDISQSMTRGEPPKLELGRKLAAAFGYLGMKQLDRVQLVPFARDLRTGPPTMRSRGEFPTLERFLAGLEPLEGATTTFAHTARQFLKRYPSRGLLVIVSDLMEAADWSEPLRLLARANHEIVVVRTTCLEDDDPGFRGEVELTDAETGERMRLAMTRSMLEAYKKVVREHVSSCRDAAARVGGRFVEAHTEQPLEKVLRAVMAPAADVART
jgi:uncharacterized protein (DUF58 family)